MIPPPCTQSGNTQDANACACEKRKSPLSSSGSEGDGDRRWRRKKTWVCSEDGWMSSSASASTSTSSSRCSSARTSPCATRADEPGGERSPPGDRKHAHPQARAQAQAHGCARATSDAAAVHAASQSSHTPPPAASAFFERKGGGCSYSHASSPSPSQPYSWRSGSHVPDPACASACASASATGSGTRSSIMCANCGSIGHVYRWCRLPITSFGVVCFRWTVDAAGRRTPQYLMVRRKDSMCFVEFVRGRYDLHDPAYMRHLLRRMTPTEREFLRTLPFEELWVRFWKAEQSRMFLKEYLTARDKFAALKKGLCAGEGDGDAALTLDALLDSTASEHMEQEWGFPKGRRNINEKDIKCALREFREETGLDIKDVHVHAYMKPFEEVFTACNGVRYRHVYYMMQIKQQHDIPLEIAAREEILQRNDRQQAREIGGVAWFTAEDVLSKINADNAERRNMFRSIHDLVMRSQYLQAPKASWMTKVPPTLEDDYSVQHQHGPYALWPHVDEAAAATEAAAVQEQEQNRNTLPSSQRLSPQRA